MGDTNPTNAEPLYIQYKVPDDEHTFRPSWPRLSCRVINEVLLEGTKLQFGNRHDQPGDTHDWEISSFTNQHRLAFNRVGGVSLDLSVKGPMRFLTGDPAQNPSERLRILANGFVGIGISPKEPKDMLHVGGGNMRLDNNRGFFIEDAAGAAKRVLFADPSNNLHLGSGDGGGFGRIDFDIGNTGTVMTLIGSRAGFGTVDPENSEGWNRVLDLKGVQHAKLSVRTNSIDARIMAHESGFWGAPAGMVVGTKGNHPLSLATNAAARLTILANGNVKIGTPALSAKLEVNGSLDVTGNATVNNFFLGDVGWAAEGWHGICHSNQVGQKSYALLQHKDGLYTLINKKAGGGYIGFRVDNIDKMVIGDNGRVGIGTTGPSEMLEVSGNAKINNVFLGDLDGDGFWAQVGHSALTNSFEPALWQSRDGYWTWFSKKYGSGKFEFYADGNLLMTINDYGDLWVARNIDADGSKAGYVVERFVNRAGDILEQGDVVVISRRESTIYFGADNNIPLLEVDLTTKAYDTRVCGIVANCVTEQELPFAEAFRKSQFTSEARALPEGSIAKGKKHPPFEHPLKQFAVSAGAAQDRRSVQDQQIGMMATLGAYAHCKVDADVAPIETGDLLTTSPTERHAQKALDPAKSKGAIIGKALGSLKKGRGKIPVLVMLQ